MSDLVSRLRSHIAMMAPHQRERVGGRLLVESFDEIRELRGRVAALEAWRDETVANCSVASDPPYFLERKEAPDE